MAKILIIEPSEQMRELLAGHLTSRGHEVEGVEHGLAAARAMRERLPDAVLLDQSVVMGGLQTARLLRLHPRYQKIPIVLTVDQKQAGEALIQEGKKLGLSQFVVKPCTTTALEAKVQAALRSRLEKLTVADMREQIDTLTNLPVLMSNQRKMLSLLSREDAEVDVPELVRTIETDQGLTAEVLRLCHSAYYGFRGNSIESATTFLGTDKLRHIVQASIIFDIFQSERGGGAVGEFSILDLWKHSVACGLVMEEGGHRVKGRDHFIAGMLHDVGKVILHLRFREHFEEAVRIARAEQKSIRRAEEELIGITHTDVGYELARKWELPPTIAAAIAHHHRPSGALQHKRLASLVHLSDILVRVLEIGDGGDTQKIQMDPVAEPLAKYVFEVSRRKDTLFAEVESVVSEGREQA